MNPTSQTQYTYKLTGKDGLVEFGQKTFSNAHDAENALSDKIQQFDCYQSGCLVEIKELLITSRYQKLTPKQFGDICDSHKCICDSYILLTSRMTQNVYKPTIIKPFTIQLVNLSTRECVTLDADSALLVEQGGRYRLEAREVESRMKYEFHLYMPASSKVLDSILNNKK
jgi:hypothetical protein